MTIEILLDPKAENYQQFHQGLEKEIGALNVEYSRKLIEAPPNTLSVPHDVVQYVINHPEVLKVLPYIIEIVHTAIERWKVPADKKNPPAAITVDGTTLKMPASVNAQRKFVSKLDGGDEAGTKRKRKAKTQSRNRRKRKSKNKS